ncbi:odorant receptor Or2-like [Schistocerca gregaria]|uniref:odorant receptor Or2-like n=1 Tax=Schistocerca gregaria TaxID=7010 RepID=UPI00211F386C|nr:odorant receptor Or2-like [Schistocerca gregaria]
MLVVSSGPPSAAAAEEASDLDFMLNVLHWSGLMRHPHAGPWSRRIHHLINAFSTVALLLFICSQAVLLWRHGTTDLEVFTLILCILNTSCSWMIRLRHIASWEVEFQRLATEVRFDFDEFLSADDLWLLRLRSRSQRRFVSAYLCSGVFTSAVFAAIPVSAEGFPFIMALPYDANQPLAFATTWLYTAYIVFFVVLGNRAADSFNISLIVQLRNQLDLLSRKLRNLNGCISHTKSSIKKTKRSEDVSEDVYYQLRKSILHHQSIIRNVQLLEQCLGRMLLGQCLSNGTSFCLLLFQAAKRAKGVQELGKTCSYLLNTLFELFVYCWFGDDLIFKSENVASSAYDAVPSLQECPTGIKRSLLLLMLRAQRPLRISAGGFFALCRESFVSVLNVSYSFFTILRNFKED